MKDLYKNAYNSFYSYISSDIFFCYSKRIHFNCVHPNIEERNQLISHLFVRKCFHIHNENNQFCNTNVISLSLHAQPNI